MEIQASRTRLSINVKAAHACKSLCRHTAHLHKPIPVVCDSAGLLDVANEVPRVVDRQQLLLMQLQKGQGHAVQHFGALEQQRIPHSCHCLHRRGQPSEERLRSMQLHGGQMTGLRIHAGSCCL